MAFCCQDTTRKECYLTAQDWITVAEQIPDYARVTLTGGEPLMFDGFEEVFRFVAGRNKCNVITNGILLNEDILGMMLSYDTVKVLSVSIDDIGNRCRRMTDRQWRKLVDNIGVFNRMRGGRCALDVKTMVLDENASDLVDVHRYCCEVLKCDTHAFQFLKGSPIQHSDRMFDFGDIVRPTKAYRYKRWRTILDAFEKIRQYNCEGPATAFTHPKGIELNSAHPVNDPGYLNTVRFVPGNFRGCKYPWSSVHINCDGNVIPCLAVSMGNVKNSSLESIIRGERSARFRELIKEHGTVQACNRCGWIKGNHPHE